MDKTEPRNTRKDTEGWTLLSVSFRVFRGLIPLTFLVGCGGNAGPETKWVDQREATAGPIFAVVEVNRLEALPGQRLDVRLTVDTPIGGVMKAPMFNHTGLESVDEKAAPADLIEPDMMRHRFHWVLQAGPPAVLTDQIVSVTWLPPPPATSQQLKLTLPPLTIQSAFADGAFANTLPPAGAAP